MLLLFIGHRVRWLKEIGVTQSSYQCNGGDGNIVYEGLDMCRNKSHESTVGEGEQRFEIAYQGKDFLGR